MLLIEYLVGDTLSLVEYLVGKRQLLVEYLVGDRLCHLLST